ncbi:MAG: methylated-DNA--[protein]-cysteine S-methyltransferase [Vampirovibrionia bacterium]
MIIDFTTISTPLNTCSIGAIENNICWFSFNDEGDKLASFVKSFNEGLKSKKNIDTIDIIAKANSILANNLLTGGLELKENKNAFSETIQILEKYFNGVKTDFTTIKTIYLSGTEFHHKIWDSLKTIKYGTTISYKELATMAGSPKAYRAAGNANGLNMIPLIIPCHRVIKTDGTPGGYSGGVDIKIKLLKVEGITSF